jgi:hypothetical protein
VAQRPRFEVADVVRAYADDYRRAHPTSAAQERVLGRIATCRTAALGGHVDECTQSCGYVRISYNSCRDRHCPKCQAPRRAQWLSERLERLLPVPYFHVVFTIPHDLNPLALRNKAAVYSILFQAASRTLLELARDPERLGADIGVTAVLHTWGQNLMLHPHLHCVVTGGGLSLDGERWVVGRERYLLPVKVLAKLFRGKFLALLERAYKAGELEFAGSTAELADPNAWAGLRDRLYRKDWVVYAKPPFGGAEQVFRYLGRYTHRVAISNHRIVNFADGEVSFTYKDYKDGARTKTMTLGAVEFLRRFLLHVLPKRFVRIRHYGLHASRNVNTKLVAARRLLEPGTPDPSSASAPNASQAMEPVAWWERFHEQTGIDVMACPCCGARLIRRPALPTELSTGVILSLARAPPSLA